MKDQVRLTSKQKVDIINAYQDELQPMIELADKYGVSRQAIYKICKRAGCDTGKHQLDVSCSCCGKAFKRHKSRIRRQLNNFCSEDCYYAFLQAGNGQPYKESRYGSMIARDIVKLHFQLQDGMIVHHDDRNQYNNNISNLRVFANQGDHVRYHRGFDVQPIWDGSRL